MNLKHLGGLASVVQDILKKYLGGLPDVVQYIVVIAMVLVILYLCLIVTRALGRGKGEFVRYDDNEENDKKESCHEKTCFAFAACGAGSIHDRAACFRGDETGG